MKYSHLVFVSLTLLVGSTMGEDLICRRNKVNVTLEWIRMDKVCIGAVRQLLDKEMFIANQYLALAAYHLTTFVSRPGYAEKFFSSADEHRSNCKRLIDYLTMRGQNVDGINSLLKLNYIPTQTRWENVHEALSFALTLEAEVSNQYNSVIGTCTYRDFKDYNLGNWLTRTFVRRLYNDMKWYADADSTLQKVFATNGFYGEWLLDRGYTGVC